VIHKLRLGLRKHMTQGAKRLMDVEDVVRWACGQGLEGRRGSDGPQRLGLNLRRDDASLVGRWMWPAGFPEISPMFAGAFATGGSSRGAGALPGLGARRSGLGTGDPDEDALLVETAIGGLAAAMAGRLAPEALALDIGLPVDVDGAYAAAIANIVNLTLVHGRMASRPALGPERPAPFAKAAPNGKPGVWRQETWREPTVEGSTVEREVETRCAPIRHDLYPGGAYCRLEWDPDPQTIVNARAEYLAWRQGLEALAEALSGKMERIAALPPAAALAPWLGEADADKPRDLFGPGAERVYSGREALAIAARREARERRRPMVASAPARRPTRPGKGAAEG